MKRNRTWNNKVLCRILLLSIFLVTFLFIVWISRIVKDNETKYPNQTQETTEEETLQEEISEEVSPQETSQEYATEQETDILEKEEQGYIIIGDSHAVVTDGQGYNIFGSSVEGVVLDKNLFIVHTGLDPVMGTLEWLEGDGTKRIEEIITEHTEISQWNIISIHGTSMVTIPGIAEQYIDNYKDWINNTFRGYHIYIVSIPPLDEAEWKVRHPDMPARSNKDIIAFNTSIKEVFLDDYFDYYDWFLEHNDFQDEIHYTGKTYCEMFDEIIGQIQKINE